MGVLGEILADFFSKHKRMILALIVIFGSALMIFRGLMQQPQIEKYRTEIAKTEQKISYEKNRQAEIEDLKTKVNTDEYIERIASEKLGLVKSNAKIFIDISETK